MSSASVYLAVAAMCALRASNQALPKSRSDFVSLIEERYGWRIDDLAVDRILKQLEAWGRISVTQDKYAGETLSLYYAKVPEAFEFISNSGHKDVVAKANAGGVEWFRKVFENRQFWEDLAAEPLPAQEEAGLSAIEFDEVPASDRIVTRADNRIEIEVIEADIRSIVDEIETNNEASIDLGDEKEIIGGELKAAETLVSQPSFRLSRFASLILPVLRYLADKFSAGAIGELAKRLINAIVGLG